MLFPGLDAIKPFSSSTQLSMKLSMLVNVKMSTIVELMLYMSEIFQACRDDSLSS